MANTIEINALTAVVNGKTWAVAQKPKYKAGKPKIVSKTSMVGDTVSVSQSRDFSEAMSRITLYFVPTIDHVKALEEWQNNIGKNAIMILDKDTGFTKTFNNMSVTEDTEIDFSSDNFEVMFEGSPAI